jgi:hypothetical protein
MDFPTTAQLTAFTMASSKYVAAIAPNLLIISEENDDRTIVQWKGDTIYNVVSFKGIDGKIQIIHEILNKAGSDKRP